MIDQFVYHWAVNPNTTRPGFDVQASSRGITKEELTQLGSFCFFSPLASKAPIALNRRLLNSGRVALLRKQYISEGDRLYVVHGLVGAAEDLDLLVSSSMAVSDWWIRTANNLPQPGSELPAAALPSLPVPILAGIGEDVDLVWALEQSGQVDFADDYLSAVTLLTSVAGACAPATRAAVEFQIGEWAPSFGKAIQHRFARALLRGNLETKPSKHEIESVGRLSRRWPDEWPDVLSDPRLTYQSMDQLSEFLEGADYSLRPFERLTRAPNYARLCICTIPSFVEALIEAAAGTAQWQSRAQWTSLICEFASERHPLTLDFGARQSRDNLLGFLKDPPKRTDAFASAVCARLWVALNSFEKRLVPPSEGLPAWLHRYISGECYSSPSADTPEPMEPEFLSWLLRLDPDINIAREIDLTLKAYGEPALHPLAAELARPKIFEEVYLARVADGAGPGERAKLLAVLPAQQALLAAFRLEPDADVRRLLLRLRPDIGREDLASASSDLQSALYPFLGDMPGLWELVVWAISRPNTASTHERSKGWRRS